MGGESEPGRLLIVGESDECPCISWLLLYQHGYKFIIFKSFYEQSHIHASPATPATLARGCSSSLITNSQAKLRAVAVRLARGRHAICQRDSTCRGSCSQHRLHRPLLVASTSAWAARVQLDATQTITSMLITYPHSQLQLVMGCCACVTAKLQRPAQYSAKEGNNVLRLTAS